MNSPAGPAEGSPAPPDGAGDPGLESPVTRPAAPPLPEPVESPGGVTGTGSAAPQPPVPAAEPRRRPAGVLGRFFELRDDAPHWQVIVLGLACVTLVYLAWWFVTRGEGEQRIVSPVVLPSPAETFATFHSLWFDRALTRNIAVTLRRLLTGFGLAAAVGVPLGILCGCFSRVHAFFQPLILFGRNIPLAALVGLMFLVFGTGELQKTMFIFFACVAFVVSDTAGAVRDVGSQYVDTALTLGASRWQVIFKVLVPLAMPSVFNSLRLLFGLAFGYIMLAETVKFGTEAGGLGDIINTSMRRSPREHVYLVLLIIPLVALAIDRILLWIQRELFPHRFGGHGLLNQCVRWTLHLTEDLKHWIFGRRKAVGP